MIVLFDDTFSDVIAIAITEASLHYVQTSPTPLWRCLVESEVLIWRKSGWLTVLITLCPFKLKEASKCRWQTNDWIFIPTTIGNMILFAACPNTFTTHAKNEIQKKFSTTFKAIQSISHQFEVRSCSGRAWSAASEISPKSGPVGERGGRTISQAVK